MFEYDSVRNQRNSCGCRTLGEKIDAVCVRVLLSLAHDPCPLRIILEVEHIETAQTYGGNSSILDGDGFCC